MIKTPEQIHEHFKNRRLTVEYGDALETVRSILHQVEHEGDTALQRISQEIDGHPVEEIPKRVWREAYENLDADLRDALETAKERIEAFYRREPMGGFLEAGTDGVLGQLVRPLDRVGVYVPGGSAPLLSTVLMTAVPAKVAGVGEIVLASPPRVHPGILAAAWVAGADRLFAMGGAQAIAALAYGTETIPRVDKIVGPGNRYVVLAKREVYGSVGMEGLPGPTETLIIADASADPKLLAADLLAQAEHGPDSEAWLLSSYRELLERVEEELQRQLADLPRASIARQALQRSGLVQVESIEQALELANLYAPEHLCLSVNDPLAVLGQVRNAGGIFLGEHSCEALGDYIAGPSHVMPTAGTARFGGGLALRDFLKVIPVVGLNQAAAGKLAALGARMAREEGLEAHARALDRRAKG
ncbi:histidinol dehydrogenase [Meiothermus ruber]|jgi:histidinol dehydrogenase|uniref:Histidinol dehydrogenase n=1 Tax=Meiothermus ruber (strain ATCC 35948 / DSM 1279 / VKM B-1258 / 21) TaxID=504728 RepID=D3PPC3_MEIRD|nr:histidinol dehydrogenase [Meiothermus ruber]ADD27532.1 histidinol dehydrogenase [Meiothermus ruber DSM 1279]AGK03995.1 histidinol dehydrogenase [Meiothermus ruber DSM 1279]MCL6530612.1 histidinol dehydrogenase [Meiothermus ruber]